MKKLTWFFALTLGAQLAAQQPPAAPAPQPAPDKTTEAKPADPAPAKEEEKPILTEPEPTLHSTADVGWRNLFAQHGDAGTYRSIVNLKDGARVLGWSSALNPIENKLLDSLRLSGANWGDPNASLRLSAEKRGIYRYTLDYRNLWYYNQLPSFANPAAFDKAQRLVASGNGSQRALDTRSRFFDMNLDLLSKSKWQPFFGLAWNTNQGLGITPITLDTNTYPASTGIDYSYKDVHAGLRYQGQRIHFSFEQGHGEFKDNQAVDLSQNNLGDILGQFLGQTLQLTSARQRYQVTGANNYTSAHATVSPVEWLDLSGQIYYSRPTTNAQMTEGDTGTLFLLDLFRFASGQQSIYTSYANRPRTTGVVTFELRPTQRLRVAGSLDVENMNGTGNVLGLFTFTPATIQSINSLTPRRFDYNRREYRVTGYYDLSHGLTLFAGHRYEWGDASVPPADLLSSYGYDTGSLRRQVGVFGASYRTRGRLSGSFEANLGRGDSVYFRTTPRDFELYRARLNYQATQRLRLGARFVRNAGHNPTTGIGLESLAQQASAVVEWRTKFWSWVTDYTNSSIKNDLTYYQPQNLQLLGSNYRDLGHAATMYAEFRLPRNRAQIIAGGSLFNSHGSRPTRYYQPLARVYVPVTKGFQVFGEWRNYSLGQNFAGFESFGAQQFTVGLRLKQ